MKAETGKEDGDARMVREGGGQIAYTCEFPDFISSLVPIRGTKWT